MAIYQKETGTAHGRGFSGADPLGILTKFLSWVKRPAADGSPQAFTADAPSNNITCAGHGYVSGDSVKCTNSGGTLPGGLALLTEYYVIYGDVNTFKLATTYQNAISAVAIDITNSGSGTHSVYKLGGGAGWFLLENKSNPQSMTFTCDYTTDIITAAAHGFGTGDIVWCSNVGGALPGGLVASTTYYVIRINANTFKVASSLQLALAGTAINITSNGTGTHSIVQIDKYIVVCDVAAPVVNAYASGPTGGPPKFIRISMVNSESGYIRIRYLLWWDTTTKTGYGYWAGYRVTTSDDADYMYDFRGGAETLIVLSVIGTAISPAGITEFTGDANLLEGTDKVGVLQSGVTAGSSVVLQLAAGQAINFTVNNYYFLYDFAGHSWVDCVKVTARDSGTDQITVDTITQNFPAGAVIAAYAHRVVAFGSGTSAALDNISSSYKSKLPYTNATATYVFHLQYGGIYGGASIVVATVYLDRMAPNRKQNWCVMNPGIAEVAGENAAGSWSDTYGAREGYGTLKNVIISNVGTMAPVLNGRTDGGKNYKYFVLSSAIFNSGVSTHAACFLDDTSTS
jgi:hypothetical protein